MGILMVLKGKGKGRYSSSWEPHLRAMGRHLPYGITQCYLPPNTSERVPPDLSHAGWYSIYLLRRDGRLGCPSWLDSAPAGSQTTVGYTSVTRASVSTVNSDITILTHDRLIVCVHSSVKKRGRRTEWL